MLFRSIQLIIFGQFLFQAPQNFPYLFLPLCPALFRLKGLPRLFQLYVRLLLLPSDFFQAFAALFIILRLLPETGQPLLLLPCDRQGGLFFPVGIQTPVYLFRFPCFFLSLPLKVLPHAFQRFCLFFKLLQPVILRQVLLQKGGLSLKLLLPLLFRLLRLKIQAGFFQADLCILFLFPRLLDRKSVV